MKRILLILVIGLFGCTPIVSSVPSINQRTAVFNFKEYEPCLKKGTGIIQGQAFMKTRAGDVKFSAGNKVYLEPVTEYSKEFYEKTAVLSLLLEPKDPKAPKMREVIADATGNFVFTEIPACDYFIYSDVIWEYPTAYGFVKTGGIAFARVTVKEGETVKTIVTK